MGQLLGHSMLAWRRIAVALFQHLLLGEELRQEVLLLLLLQGQLQQSRQVDHFP